MNVLWKNSDEITGDEIVFIAEEYRLTDSVDKEKLRTMVIFICPSVWPQAIAISIEREREREIEKERTREREERRCLACQPSSPPLYLQPPRCTNFCRRWRWSCMCLRCVCVCVWNIDAKDGTSVRGVCVYCHGRVGKGGGGQTVPGRKAA